jgi:beta-lactamase superfamily II metal-dependent hydrolase
MRSKRRWYPILLIGIVLLLAGSVVGCPQPPVSTPPIIAEFSANPTNINSGESATLSWSVTEATTVTIDQGIGDVPSSRMQSVSPTTTTTYTLTASNSAGTVTKSVVITVVIPPPGELTVHFIDVGQGDSILVDLGETEVLIDGGDKSPGVVSYLNDYVDGALEVMVATHPHADHIGGLIGVLDAFEVDEIWLNRDTTTSETYSQFMSAVNSEGAQVYEARRGDTIEASELVFNVLHPASLDDTTNNNSIVLSLSHGDNDFLLMGDAEKEAEASMLAAGLVQDIDILKVGHHGSKTASSLDFLNAAKPEIAIYMAGIGNSYGHPHQDTINALTQIGAEIYGTDICGTIVVTSDGESLAVQTEKQCVPPEPAKFVVSDLSISPSEVKVRESVIISATVTNSGGSSGSYTAILKINGGQVETKSITLNAGESYVASFSVVKESSGTYTVELGGLAGTFTVTEKAISGALAVSASVKFPSLGGGTQTLYATVTLSGQPVQGADVGITVYYKTVTRTFTASPTGSNGKTQISWSVGRPRGGYTVRIEVVATYQGQTASTTTGFYAP